MKLYLTMLLSILLLFTSSFSANNKTIPLLTPPFGFVPMEDTTEGKQAIPEYTKKRMGIFAKQDISKLQNGTVFLGDSITEGFHIEKYFPEELVINRGIVSDHIGGFNYYGVYNRLDSTIYNLHPKRIIMMIGVNDAPGMTADSTDKKLVQYDYQVWKIRHDLPDTELWCISLMPTRNKYSYLNPIIKNFNIHAKEAAMKYNAHWLDIYPSFINETRELKEEITRDGLHVNSAGYDILAQLYKDNIFNKSTK